MLVVVFGMFLEVTFTECNVIVAPDILNYKVLVFFFCILLIEPRVSPWATSQALFVSSDVILHHPCWCHLVSSSQGAGIREGTTLPSSESTLTASVVICCTALSLIFRKVILSPWCSWPNVDKCLFPLSVFESVVLELFKIFCCYFETKSHCVVQAGLELTVYPWTLAILLFQPPKCGGHRHGPPHPAQGSDAGH